MTKGQIYPLHWLKSNLNLEKYSTQSYYSDAQKSEPVKMRMIRLLMPAFIPAKAII